MPAARTVFHDGVFWKETQVRMISGVGANECKLHVNTWQIPDRHLCPGINVNNKN